MKALFSVFFLVLPVGIAFAQGPLTPPGAPAPTMKSLDQIEARKLIPASPAVPVAGPHFTINAPGSYYLTGNVTVSSGDAIRIDSDDVTLDLNGFKISSTYVGSGSGFGIAVIGNHERLTIRNGSIVSGTTVTVSGLGTVAGFQNGIFSNSNIRQALVESVHVSGIVNTGIFLDAQGIVRGCTVRNCGGTGISAHEVSDSSAELCVSTAINARNVSNSAGLSVSGTGIASTWSVINCNGTSTDGTGISCGGNVTNSSGNSANASGLVCGQNATNCSGSTTSNNVTHFALSAVGTASYSRGFRLGDVAIRAAIAVGCTVSAGCTVDSPQKHLGTP